MGPTYTTRVDLTTSNGSIAVANVSGASSQLTAVSFLSGPKGDTGATGAAGATGATGPASAWGTIPGTLSAQTDLQTALNTKEASITAGTTAQYYRGDKTFQPLNQDAVPSGTTNKAYTATEQTKLAGIATGATANSSDATLLNRANHTGSQAESTITNLVTDLAGKAATAHTHTEADVTNLTTDLAAKQATLVSGTNIKTINGSTLLGSGDLTIAGGGTAATGRVGQLVIAASTATTQQKAQADVTTTGTADQTAINTAIAATTTVTNSKTIVKLVGAFTITDAIILKSNMLLDAREASITLAVGTGNKNMLANNIVANRTVTSITTTASGTTVTATGFALTSADVGSTIKLTGAGLAGANWVTTIASITDSTHAVLTDATPTATTTSTGTIYRRDTSIEVLGGYWDRGANGGADSSLSHSLFFRHIDRLTIRDLTVATGSGKYAINPGDCTSVIIQNIRFATTSDGVHFNGPCKDIVVENIAGTTGDDMVAFTCSDYTTFNDTNGSMTNISVRNIFPNGSLSAVKATGANSETITAMSINNVQGSTSQSGIRFWNDPSIGDLMMKQVQVSNVSLKPSVLNGATTYEMMQINIKQLDDLTVSSCTYDVTGQTNDFRGARMFFFSHPYSGATNAYFKEVSLTNCKMVGVSTGALILVESNIGIDVIKTTACEIIGTTVNLTAQIGTPVGTVANYYHSYSRKVDGGVVTVYDTSQTDSALVQTTGNQTVAGTKTFTSQLGVNSTAPKYLWYESDGAVDTKRWDVLVDAGRMNWRVGNDADSSASVWLYVDRTTTTATSVNIAPSLFLSSTPRVNVSSGDVLQLNGTGTNNTIMRLYDDGAEKAAIYVLNNGADLNLRASGIVNLVANNGGTAISANLNTSGAFVPATSNAQALGASALYWSGVFATRHTFNSTAYIDGTTAGQMQATGLFMPVQAPTVSAPAYVKGAMYFDTTLNKLRIGGATAWETVTSS